MGNWWVYTPPSAAAATSTDGSPQHGTLLKVPSGREDVFQDQVLDFKAKRALMKFLRFISEYEEQVDVWNEHKDQPFPAFLTEQFKVPPALHAPLLALALSPDSAANTTTAYALPRIARHLRSIGVYGPGFGAVLPKWGGLSEIIQVACRSCAVGGGVYVLGKGVSDIAASDAAALQHGPITLHLKDGERVTAKCVVQAGTEHGTVGARCSKSITIVSSSLPSLFPSLAEGAPTPVSSVVVFPAGSLPLHSLENNVELPPVYVFVHSSDTGECPSGQSVLYASTSQLGELGVQLLGRAVDSLLSAVDTTPQPEVLWTLQYEQTPETIASSVPQTSNSLQLPPSSLDLSFDDSLLTRVKEIYQKIVGDDGGQFMVFADREGQGDDED